MRVHLSVARALALGSLLIKPVNSDFKSFHYELTLRYFFNFQIRDSALCSSSRDKISVQKTSAQEARRTDHRGAPLSCLSSTLIELV